MLKKTLACAAAVLMLSASAMAMPNPMVGYQSVYLSEKAAGFSALTAPPGLVCWLDKSFVINNNLIELRYKTDDNETITVRTAPKEYKGQNISGVFGAQWEEVNIGDLYMHVAHMDNNTSVAYWSKGQYCFSLQCTNVTPRQFFELACKFYMSISPES